MGFHPWGLKKVPRAIVKFLGRIGPHPEPQPIPVNTESIQGAKPDVRELRLSEIF
jgi:hypothetical protein